MYKVTDRDGMYVRVAPSGALSFRLDYRLNGRRETVYLGKYERDGISLARARELCLDAKRAISEGRSPAIEKQREKRRIKEAKSFGEFGEKRGRVQKTAKVRNAVSSHPEMKGNHELHRRPGSTRDPAWQPS
jgi:hypothetical protein